MKGMMIGAAVGLLVGGLLVAFSPCGVDDTVEAGAQWRLDVTPEVADAFVEDLEAACRANDEAVASSMIDHEINFLYSKVDNGGVTINIVDTVASFEANGSELSREYFCGCPDSCDSSGCSIESRQGGEVLDCRGSCEGSACGECVWEELTGEGEDEAGSLLEELWSAL